MKKVTIQLIVAIVVLLLIVGGYLVWYFAVSAQSAAVATLNGQIQQKSQTATRIAAAKAKLAQLTPEEQEVNQYFISTNNIVTFLEQLATTGQHLGATVQVASVSATPASASTPYGSLNLSLKITGSFQAVMSTLGSIEYGPYDIHTTSVTLDNAGQGSGASAQQWTAAAMFIISTQADTPASNVTQSNTATSTTLFAPAQPVTPATTSATTGVGTPKP